MKKSVAKYPIRDLTPKKCDALAMLQNFNKANEQRDLKRE
jgi:hypothetical protein